MDILWATMAICAVVSVVFYVLALSWQRTLRSQAGAIRALVQRLETLEAMEDPAIRHRIGELMPPPLEKVCIFSFRLGDQFWRETAGATETQISHIHEHGTFVGSVKIETWRSHVTVTLRELPPHSQSSGWQTRTVDVYSTDSGAGTVLWELSLDPEFNLLIQKPQILELRYENKAIVLAIRALPREAWAGAPNGDTLEEKIIFCIPLDAEQLAEFRVSETDMRARIDGEKEEGGSIASFTCQGERQGVDWQLRLRSFDGRVSAGHWTIVKPRRERRVS